MSLHDRVHVLERELRFQRGLVLVLLAALGGLGLVAAQEPAEVTPVLRVRRLLVVDTNDRPVLIAGSDESGHGRLELGDADGRITQRLGVDEEGRVQLEMLDQEDRRILWLGEGKDGGAELVALEGEGEPEDERGGGFRLGFDPQRQGVLELFNHLGSRVVFAGGTIEGDGCVRVDNVDRGRAYYMGDDARGNGIVAEDAKPGARLWR